MNPIPQPRHTIAPRHMIDTLEWACHFRNQQLAYSTQDRLGTFLRGPALQTMATLFERISPLDEVWQIDRLEVDLGVLDADATPEQWAACLADRLWDALLQQRQALDGNGPQSADRAGGTQAKPAIQHELDNFIYFLQHGRLPWSMDRLAGPHLADWLVELAEGVGPRLWSRIEKVRTDQHVRARLSQISPHHGLHALLATRHPELADALILLDEQLLLPLQGKGRLSAHQAQQIRQAWRVAALNTLWGARTSRISEREMQALITTLRDIIIRQVGGQGLLWLSTKRLSQQRLVAVSPLSHNLLAGVSGRSPDAAGVSAPPLADGSPATDATRQLLEGALLRLDMALESPQPVPAGALLPLLEALAERSPAALHARLHLHVLSRASRRTWLTTLGSHALWMLMQQLTASEPAAEGEAPEAEVATSPLLADTWAESLRQFSLAALRQPPLSELQIPLGFSAIQRWLVDYTLCYLALGHALPQDHVAWQALWQHAMVEMLGQPIDIPATGEFAADKGHRGRPGQDSEVEAHALRRDGITADYESAGGVGHALQADTATDFGAWLSSSLATWRTQPLTVARMLWWLQRAWAGKLPKDGLGSKRSGISADGTALVAGLAQIAAYVDGMGNLPPSLRRQRANAIAVYCLRNTQGDGLARYEAMWLEQLAALLHTETQADESHTTRYALTEQGEETQDGAFARWQRLIVAWMHGRWLSQAAAEWQACLRAPADGLLTVLTPWVMSPIWRRRVAARWPRARKLELFVLLDLAHRRTPPVQLDGGMWAAASARWRWLPTQVAAHADVALWAGRAMDTAPSTTQPRLRIAVLTDWLWSEAILWATQLGAASAQATSLVEHWRLAAATVLGRSKVGGGDGAAPEPLWSEMVPSLVATLHAETRQRSQPAVRDRHSPAGAQGIRSAGPGSAIDPVDLSPTRAPALAAADGWSLATLDALLARPVSAWRGADRLWLMEAMSDRRHCDACLMRYSNEQRWKLLEALHPAHVATLRRQSARLAEASRRLLPDLSADEADALHWRFLFGHCFLAGLQPTPATLSRRYAMHLVQFDQDRHGPGAASYSRWLSRLADALASAHAAAETAPAQAGTVSAEDELDDGQSALRRGPTRAEQWEATLPASRRPVHLAPPPAEPKDLAAPQTPPADAVKLEEPIYIANAGLVLLAFFTQRLFDRFGLLEERHFKDEAAQYRAIHCLAYLVDGHVDSNESDWVLNKLLCGAPLARPVPPLAGLDEETCGTMDDLLRAVIAHWKIIGNTSIPGLRGNFLQRQGRLTAEEGAGGRHWRLVVQPAPFDMLLDQLPWSYSTIKLPWMEEVLYVDWR
ncbi:MAG: hypothetical protein JO142_19395 [Burkholderiales bacterium]|nr:hypothetical protein [Burkholderiales bacterium]